jgi:anthranilate synthase component 2
MKVVVIDNFDSFTYNLVEYVSDQTLGGEGEEGDKRDDDGASDEPEPIDVTVFKNTASLAEIRAADPDAILISPGPGHPKNQRDVGVTMDVLRDLSPEIPTLGVCLGLEAAVYEYGGTVGHAPEPIHGKAFPVDHDGDGVFAGLDQGFRAGRYHSLAATAIPDVFDVTATTDHEGDEIVMGIRHREYPIEAVQFHPESVLTGAGHDLIRNFLVSV